jgi:hypothetical protein
MFQLFAAAALAAPPITTQPCTGICAPAAPIEAVVDLHQEQALAIYRPYFECYWSSLSAQSAFGSKVAKEAQAALVTARNSCASLRTKKDREFERFLASKKIYGSRENVLKIREQFRSQAGTIFNFMTASANGKRAEYLATMQSALELDAK